VGWERKENRNTNCMRVRDDLGEEVAERREALLVADVRTGSL
jgi:hypothetical protein